MEIVETDVLVIGGGLTGLLAAIEARKQVANVMLVSKTPPGFASCSAHSAAGFTCPIGGMTYDEYVKLTIETGKYINNQNLVEVLAKEAVPRLVELQDYGVRLTFRYGKGYAGSRRRHIIMHGLELTKPLVDYARSKGIRLLGDTMIFNLLVDGTIEGALGFSTTRKEIVIKAKAVVIASGGACQIYSRTDNPSRTTGDGYFLAFNVGLPLLDMEFVQFYPIGLAERGYPIFMFPISLSLLNKGVLQNKNGEDIIRKYGLNPKFRDRNRDAWTNAIANEILQGRGEDYAVFLNLTKFPRKQLQLDIMKPLARVVETFPFETKPLHVSPVAHTFMGGVLINEDCETDIPGLYAAGEAAGGARGANRLGGNALTECVVYGARSGHNAADFARKRKSHRSIDRSQVKRGFESISEIEGNPPSKCGNPRLMKDLIKETMWKNAGIIRNEKSLSLAEQTLKQIGDENLPRLRATNSRELVEVLECRSMFLVAQMVVAAAQRRTETRGTHNRTDYPFQNDKDWLVNVILRKIGNVMKIETRPSRRFEGEGDL